jgi:A/G-specific adenine glycosylase
MTQEQLYQSFFTSNPSDEQIHEFQERIYQHYHQYSREFSWRKTDDPYHILVSEIMLQQTQTSRVISKYEQFIAAFPDFQSLAQASFRDVLAVWSGLGYNRRALMLKKIAETVVNDFHSHLPSSIDELMKLPGIGIYTASALCAFAFNQPTVLIETNIRTVFIHFFFNNRKNVRDAELIPLIEQTLDRSNPKEWYYALMDYGVTLKKQYTNPSRRSAHYYKQSPFKGSNRQIRGMILKTLVTHSALTEQELIQELDIPPQRVQPVIGQLHKEGLVKKKGKTLMIA